MKIAWCTPFSAHSAIARFSFAVVKELRVRGHEISIVRLELDDEILSSSFDEREDVDLDVPSDADIVVVNFGNHAPYHAKSMLIISKYPALLILHDAEMRHFEHGMRHLFAFEMPTLPFSAPIESDAEGDQRLLHTESARILQLLASLSSGCVTHGPHYVDPLRESCPGVVSVLPLCYPDRERSISETQRQVHDTFNVTVFGHLNPNKQLDRVLRAVAMLKHIEKPVRVIFSGAIELHHRNNLNLLVAELGISPPVFTGRLDDDELSATLFSSDVICCLRMPVTEGGSASAATAMHHARPLIVSDVGSFSMIPDDLVYKVSFSEDVVDLAAVLQRVAENPKESEQRARAAQAWAAHCFSAAAYVDGLDPVLNEALRIAPSLAAARHSVGVVQNPFGRHTLEAITSISIVMDELIF